MIEAIFNSLVSKELLRDIVEANLCKIFDHIHNGLIDACLQEKLKNLDVPDYTELGPIEVESVCFDEFAEEKDTDARVLGGEEFGDKGKALDGDESKLGDIEEADGHFGTSAIELVSIKKIQHQYFYI